MSQGCVFPAHGSTFCFVCVVPATRSYPLCQSTTFTTLRLFAHGIRFKGSSFECNMIKRAKREILRAKGGGGDSGR
jgi:hypothetical protein